MAHHGTAHTISTGATPVMEQAGSWTWNGQPRDYDWGSALEAPPAGLWRFIAAGWQWNGQPSNYGWGAAITYNAPW